MTGESIYIAWAPQASPWSQWAKPVLFAHMNSPALQTPQTPDPMAFDKVAFFPRAEGSTAVVVDLPGVQSVEFGLRLAGFGFRPVPLFNSVPSDINPAIAMGEVVSALASGAQYLQHLDLPAQAPPAFLLDSRRRGIDMILSARMFDNRSVSLPTDFPSANFLLHRGIKRVILVQENTGPQQQDLAHTLRRWQLAGIKVLSYATSMPAAPSPTIVQRPPWFRHFWYGLLARFGLRRHPLGGFGGFIPEPSSMGG